MSEVPLGTILSGGLDSGTVATIHQALAGRDRPIQTFTLADSAAVEDFQVAHRLAATLGTQHHEATLAYDDVWRHLPQHALAQENTNYTESFFWFLFRFMRPHVTVGLCGQGSDELWGGYARYRKRMDLEQERAVRAARMQIPFQTAWGDAHRHAERLARFDQGGQLHNFQLRLVDRNSMTHSLEVRVPFLSSRLQALSDGTSWEWKLPKKDAEKLVLRKAADLLGVPKEVAWRPKVPAGTATSPTIVARLDAEAARLVPAKTGHVLLDALPKPMDRLMLGVWREVFEHRRGEASGVTLETVAANLGGRA